MSKTKTISIPSIAGEFVTLIELSRLANIPYSTVFHWQDATKFLPVFRFENIKMNRFKKTESLSILSKFVELRKGRTHKYNFLEEIKSELQKDIEYQSLHNLAESHRIESEKKKAA